MPESPPRTLDEHGGIMCRFGEMIEEARNVPGVWSRTGPEGQLKGRLVAAGAEECPEATQPFGKEVTMGPYGTTKLGLLSCDRQHISARRGAPVRRRGSSRVLPRHQQGTGP